MLNEKQMKAAKMLASGDYLQKDIAKVLKVSEATVTNWKKNSEFAKLYEQEVNNNLKYLSHDALSTMKKLLNANNENVRYSAAKDILDRTGFKGIDKIEISGEVENPYKSLTEAELRKLINDE